MSKVQSQTKPQMKTHTTKDYATANSRFIFNKGDMW